MCAVVIGAIGTLAIMSVAGSASAQTSAADFVQMDRAFVCPENLPSDAARAQAEKDFVDRLRQLKLAPKEIYVFRMNLLRSHHCVTH